MGAPSGEVIVTGGLGFIGSHLVDAYLAADHRVTIIDSNAGAVIDGENYDADPRCTVVRRRVEDYLAAGGDFAGADRVIHAASYVGPASILSRAGRLGHDIIGSTAQVIDACISAGAPLCLFSSAEVYGRSGVLAEKDDILVPTHYNARIEYAIAKTLTEALVLNSRHRGLRGFVIRPFNVAGSRQSRAGGFVMPTFVQQALAEQPLTVFAGGEQVSGVPRGERPRPGFLIEHTDAALDSDDIIFNLGNPATRSPSGPGRADREAPARQPVAHRARRRAELSTARTTRRPSRSRSSRCCERRRVLGWQPRIALDELITETAEYYRAREDARGAVNAPLDRVLVISAPCRRRSHGLRRSDGRTGSRRAAEVHVLYLAVDGMHHYGLDGDTSYRQRLDEIEDVLVSGAGSTYEIAYGDQDLTERLDTLPRRELVDRFEQALNEREPDLLLLPGFPTTTRIIRRCSTPRTRRPGRSPSSSATGWCRTSCLRDDEDPVGGRAAAALRRLLRHH